MVNLTHGQLAEDRVASSLKDLGYKIVARNWRTPRCEIDIVARKGNVVYLVEVKYRQTQSQGSGFDYLTAKKLKQMQLAAEIWAAENSWPGDYRLMAAEVDGENYKLSTLIEL